MKPEVNLHINRAFYRDHLLHAIDVFLLGYLLLNTFMKRGEGVTEKLVHLFHRLYDRQQQTHDSTALMRIWAVTSLFHDVGYQASKQNFADIISLFSLDPQKELSDIAPPLKLYNEKEAQRWLKKLHDNLCTILGEDERESQAKDILYCPEEKEWDHGVVSALRVAQIATAIDRQNQSFYEEKNKISYGYLSQLTEALYAVSHHNLDDTKLSLVEHPFAFLLVLCDELQEWGRRRFDMERLVKMIYLQLQDVQDIDLHTDTPLNLICASLELEWEKNVLSCHLAQDNDKRQRFGFGLFYYDPTKGQYDVTTTLLLKAHNLQRLQVDLPESQSPPVEIPIILYFPIPKEYGKQKRTEYDIYTRFNEQYRCLPLLKEVELDWSKLAEKLNIFPLCRLQLNEEEKRKLPSDYKDKELETYMIFVGDLPEDRRREGWLMVHPDQFIEQFLEFKKNLLNQWIRDTIS